MEACGGRTEGLSIEARSPSLFSNELSLVSPSPQNGEDVQQSSEIPSVPSACRALENCEVDTEMKEASDHVNGASTSVVEKTVAQSPDVASENLNTYTEIGKIAGGTTARGSNIGVSRIPDENNGVRDQCKDSRPPMSLSSRRQKFKEGLRQGLIDCGNIDVSFENFPYYLR